MQAHYCLLMNYFFDIEPTSAPKDVKVDRIHPTVMVVSWTPLTLSEARGFITSYTVFYSPQVSRRKRQEPNTMQKTVSGDVSRTTIDSNTSYGVQVSANTKTGTSALSEVILAPVPPNTGNVTIITVVYFLSFHSIHITDYYYACILLYSIISLCECKMVTSICLFIQFAYLFKLRGHSQHIYSFTCNNNYNAIL